jgi:hypothetical protein
MPSDARDFSAKAFRLWHANRRNEFVRMVAEADTLKGRCHICGFYLSTAWSGQKSDRGKSTS